jgi:prepilin-type N-terminal cleavage/methylation domain-containing protein
MVRTYFRDSSARRNEITFQRSNRSAFTLVEMLVAVALVLLMMSIFAEVFAIATSSMSRQKGLAENDQRARMVTTLINSDFRKRTFRDVIPYVPVAAGTATDLVGYMCYSENSTTNDNDDVLRLTINTANVQQDLDPDAYLLYGKATLLAGLAANPNQPEGDDGPFITALSNGVDSTGQSTAAEVVWFLRNGNLYRRMVLIRQPYRSDVPVDLGDPTTGNPPTSTPLISGPYPGNFYSDFDYSAFFNTASNRPQFHSYASLRPAVGAGSYNLGLAVNIDASLTIPHLRFGHSLTVSAGFPREFTNTGEFIGSFTHQETSDPAFQYPGKQPSGMSDPFTRTLTLDPTTKAVAEYQNGSRIGQDLLLSNVLSFDVKIWDEGAGNGPDGQPGFAGIDDDRNGTIDNLEERGAPVLPDLSAPLRKDIGSLSDDGDWVDLGHNITTGYYCAANNSNPAYGNRFDTWSAASALASPPFQAMRYVSSTSSAGANAPYRSRSTWQKDTAYTAGTIVLPNDVLGRYPANPHAYMCLVDGTSGPTEPPWDKTTDYAKYPEVPTNPMLTGAYWIALPNLVAVKSLRIQIRYLDISSGLVKDLTLIQSLRDKL